MAESIGSAEKIGSLFAGEGRASVGEAGCEEIPEEPVSDESAFSQNAGEAGHPARPMGPALARMQAAMNSFRSYLEKGGRVTR